MVAQFSLFFLALSLLGRILLSPTSSDVDLFFTNSDTARVLLLTAHPDDECLFFAPTVTSLLASPSPSDDREGQLDNNMQGQRAEVFSLCLSVGDAEGLGGVRRNELANSLDILGVPENKRWVVDHPELQDNMTLFWDEDIIAQTIKPYVLANNITTILTFDRQGISSHPNHASLPSGAARLISSLSSTASTTPPPRLFSLITVPLVPKYVGPLAAALAKLDLSFAALLRRFDLYTIHRMPVFVSGVGGYRTALRAMQQHRSQLVWFRWLYVSFSRYMWVNEWVEVLPPSHTTVGDSPSPVAVA